MLFLTTTKPPDTMPAREMRIEHAPPVFFRGEPESPAEAAATVMAQILDCAGEGFRAVTLRNWCNDDVMPVVENRTWWREATDTLAKQLAASRINLHAMAVDHARYPTRATPGEVEWLTDCITTLVPLANRFGVFGIPAIGPTVWKSPDRFAWRDDYDRSEIAWVTMPGQYRPGSPPPSVLEFAGVIEAIRSRGMDTCIVWSDPGNDVFGRPKTRPDDWHSLLIVAALTMGRRVEMTDWILPDWMPPATPPTMDEILRRLAAEASP